MAGLSIAVLLLLTLFFYRETSLFVMGLWNRWDSGEYYAHGYLAVIISLYLVYSQRGLLGSLTPCPSFIALFAVAASGLLWLAALLADVLMVQIIALLLLIISVIWATAGSRATRHLLFPLLIIVFALPIWDPLPPILQEMTTDAVFQVIRLVGVPALREGHLITLPAGQLAINESCSGLSYLLAALTLGMLYAHLNYQGFWSRVLIVMVSGIAAILANMVRVFIVVYVAYKTDMQHPLVNDHFNLGWFLFGGLVLVLIFIETRVFRHASRSGGTDRSQAADAAGLCKYGYLQRMFVLVATFTLVAAGPAVAWWVEVSSPEVQDVNLEFPAGAGGWSGPMLTQDRWVPVFQGAISGMRAYGKDGKELYLYVGYYPVQDQGKELIYYLNRITNDEVWRPATRPERVTTTNNHTVIERVLESPVGQQRLVWYWYRVAGEPTTTEIEAKVLQVRGLLLGRYQASVVAIGANFDSDVDDARKVLSEFISEMRRPLEQMTDGPS